MRAEFGHQVHEAFVEEVRKVVERRKRVLAALRTPAQARAYSASVRRKLAGAFGPMPLRTPLQTRTTGVIRKKGFSIEKIIYESRPGLPVPANLYVPDDLRGKAPAVLGLCGHAQNGKACPEYQSFCQGLALKGYIVLILDPVSQGERYQFLGVPEAEAVSGRCTAEHNMIGKALGWTGDFLGSWMVWDAIRGMDFLQGRPDVDRFRIGITGNSGGGTQTAYVQALDPRFAMAAPGCYITSWLRNLENELPADCEQIPPGLLGLGLEMGDLLLARAPRPVMILGQKNDFFDPRGTLETFEEVRRFYALLGAENRVRLSFGPGDHGYSIENREAMVGFFNEIAGVKASAREPKLELCSQEELTCSPGGQVQALPGHRFVREFTIEKAEALRRTRKRIPTAAGLRNALLKPLALVPPVSIPAHRVLRPIPARAGEAPVVFNRFAIETGPGLLALLCHRSDRAVFHIPPGKEATLYIPHLSAQDELLDGPGVSTEKNAPLFGLDVRGVGEMMPRTCGRQDDFFAPYDFDYFYASYGLLLNRPYLGGKVTDGLCAIRALRARGFRKIHLIGRGQGSLVAAFVGLFAEEVRRITLIHAPRSFEDLVRAPICRWPVSCSFPGILELLDLPDLYRALAPKKLRLVQPWDARFRPVRSSGPRSSR
ncbi:MAG: acetylxylan esterase [Kiritimatiellia bacterium]|nr:acetylxylan esterase [Kiritimatiellia bacterium]